MEMAGRDMIDYMSELFCEIGLSLSSSAKREIVRGMKEKLCYVAEDYEADMKK